MKYSALAALCLNQRRFSCIIAAAVDCKNLCVVAGCHQNIYEAGVIQRLVRVRSVIDSGTGHIDLRPVRVCLIPEHGSPCLVQFFQRTVFSFQKIPEGNSVALRRELVNLAVYLIVDLPSHNAGTLCIV